MIKLIVLDCDGVMFDSRESNLLYYNAILNLFGHPPMIKDDEDFCHMATVDEALEHIFSNYQEKLDEVKKEAKKRLNYADYSKYMRMEPDLPIFLKEAQEKYKLAISTNRSNTILPLLEEYDLKHYFLKVVTALTVKRAKPAPDGLLEILEELQCTPEETIFIGDSILDKIQASTCGVDLIAFKNKELEAKYHVSSFMEVLALPPFISC